MIDLNYYLAFVNKKYSLMIPDVLFPTKRICYVIIRKEGLLKVINPIYRYQSSSSGILWRKYKIKYWPFHSSKLYAKENENGLRKMQKVNQNKTLNSKINHYPIRNIENENCNLY